MLKLFTYLLWWLMWLEHQLESIVANISKEVVARIDSYKLPIYQSPFIEVDPKPPSYSLA